MFGCEVLIELPSVSLANHQASVRVGDLLLSEDEEFQVKKEKKRNYFLEGPLFQVTVNVTKMLKHEDHDTFSSPENLCLIEVKSVIWRKKNLYNIYMCNECMHA